MRRVVITGLGLVTPIGCGVDHAWSSLLSGKSGARRVTEFEVSDISCQIGCFIPRGAGAGEFNPDDWMEPKEQRKVDDFIVYAMGAAGQAHRRFGLDAAERGGPHPRRRPDWLRHRRPSGHRARRHDRSREGAAPPQPVFHPRPAHQSRVGLCVHQVWAQGPEPFRRHRLLYRGACHRRRGAPYRARRRRRDGRRRHGKPALPPRACRVSPPARRLSTHFNDEPTRASRPYDKDRDGFVMGEGAGVVVLESYEHAKARGAKMYAEVIGYGMSGDAYHITAPAEDGDGAFRCMTAAIKRAKVGPADIDYVNAHGTSTPHRRRDRARRRRAGVRQRGGKAYDVVDEIGDRASAWRGGRRRGDLLGAGHRA